MELSRVMYRLCGGPIECNSVGLSLAGLQVHLNISRLCTAG